MNPGATDLTGKTTEDAYNEKFIDIVPGGESMSTALSLAEDSTFCLEPTPGMFFDATVTPIKDPGNGPSENW